MAYLKTPIYWEKQKADFIFDIENIIFKVYGLTLRKIQLMLLKFILVSTFHKGLSASDKSGMQMKGSCYEDGFVLFKSVIYS